MNNTNKHYICTGGCGAVLENPDVCGAVDCPNHGQPFSECQCTDGKHQDFKGCVNCGKICKGDCAVEEFREELH